MDTYGFFKNALESYGSSGDESLEYIAIIFSGDKVIEKRLYRKNSPALMKDIANVEPYSGILTDIFSDFLSVDGVKLCDVSKKADEHFRTVFKLSDNMSESEKRDIINRFFLHIKNADRFKKSMEQELAMWGNNASLFQIGAEFEQDYTVNGIKYYIRTDENNLVPKELIGDRENIISAICREYYKPIFAGVNDSENEKERKLYFISKAIGFRSREILKHIENLAETFNWYKAIPKADFESLDLLGVYPEGIAIPLREPFVWRIYFREYLKR